MIYFSVVMRDNYGLIYDETCGLIYEVYNYEKIQGLNGAFLWPKNW